MSTQENPLNDVVIELNEKPQPRRRRKKKKKVTKEPEDDFATRRENYLQLHNFTSKIKTKQEISDMKKGVKSFYGHQNSIIESFENLFKPEKVKDNSVDQTTRARIGVYASFIVNVLLMIAKLIIAVRSNSLSVIASALDSVLDILSGSVFFVIERLKNRENVYAYPAGKQRLEPLGVIVFSTMMFTAALQLIIEGVQRLSSGDSNIVLDDYTLGILFATITVKIILFTYCQFFVIGSNSVEALAQDHRNDIISNMAGVVTAIIGYYYWWYADPIGGILIGLLITYTWASTALSTIKMLTGYRAGQDDIKKWTYMCVHHDDRIVAIDTVRGYHLSNGYIVEVDIVLPKNMLLNEAHDIGESLQYKLEELEDVERAFVHVDYEFDHKPEH